MEAISRRYILLVTWEDGSENLYSNNGYYGVTEGVAEKLKTKVLKDNPEVHARVLLLQSVASLN